MQKKGDGHGGGWTLNVSRVPRLYKTKTFYAENYRFIF